MKKLLILLTLLLLAVVNVTADDFGLDDTVPLDQIDQNKPEFKQFSVLEFGISYRTDAQDYYEKDLGVKAKLLTHFTPTIATKLGVGYYPGFRQDWPGSSANDNIKEYQLEFGFRFSAYELSLNPYLELGLEYHYYRGNEFRQNESRTGLGIGMGVERYLSKSILLNLNFHHVFNQTDYTYYVTESPPWPGDYYGPYTYPMPEEIFNASTLSLMVGFKL